MLILLAGRIRSVGNRGFLGKARAQESLFLLNLLIYRHLSLPLFDHFLNKNLFLYFSSLLFFLGCHKERLLVQAYI